MTPSRPRVIVIGAGFGGLAAAYELSKDGLADVTVLEKADDIGGVWRENTYPGAACDVPSHLYSYSFARKTNWGRRYAEQSDILGYIHDTANRFGLRDLVRTGMEVTSADYDDGTATWEVATASGEIFVADVLVPAVGQLSRPAFPPIPGLDTFAGPSFHSAEWRHDVDLTGKRIAVLGTGASAIQFVPRIRRNAAHVTVFQRSAPYVVPKLDRGYTGAHYAAFVKIPGFAVAMREVVWQITELLGLALTKVAPLARLLHVLAMANLKRRVKDPQLRAKLTPDYPIGCKRVLFSSDWYPALASDNVDVETAAITEVTATGVRTADGQGHEVLHDVDVIIYGTGFKATEFLVPMKISGRHGRDVHSEWADGARAHLGMAVPGFPNMFMIYGPNTNLGSSSIILMMELQARYIRQVVEELARGGVARAFEVRSAVEDAYDTEVQARLDEGVWTDCDSWYRTASGRVTTNWPGLVREYQRRTRSAVLADYEEILPHAATTPAAIRLSVTTDGDPAHRRTGISRGSRRAPSFNRDGLGMPPVIKPSRHGGVTVPNSSIKNEKMYEDLRKEGNSKEKAARISNAAAARGTQSVGRKGGRAGSYDDWSVADLKKRARELGVTGYSRLTKDKLIAKLRRH